MKFYGPIILPILALVAVIAACSQTIVWTSDPAVRFADSAFINARFEPLKWGSNVNFYNAFRLTLTNKTAQPLEIDWVNTGYLVNGQPFSRFIWPGIGKENVKHPPPDVVGAGGDFSKLIVPLNLIAWKPLSSASDTAAFSAGPLMEGANSIDLVFRQDNQQHTERMTVVISTH